MHPEAILSFTLFGQDVNIYLYGVMIALGLVACVICIFIFTKMGGMHQDVQDYCYFVAIGGVASGFLAAALFQSIYEWLDTGVWSFPAGLTVMGGIVGGVIGFLVIYFGLGHFIFKKRNNIHVKQFSIAVRVAPICITAAHGFGRLGCLFAGCCHGKFVDGRVGSFGTIYMEGTRGWGYYVPTQLYESLFLFALCAVLIFLFYKRCNITHAIYLIAYGCWRIFIEFFRADYRGGSFLGLSPSQWQSCIFILLGIGIIVFYIIKKWPMFLPKDENTGKVEEIGSDEEIKAVEE